MSDDYEFRFKLSDSKVRCELWESSGKRRNKHDFFGGQDIDLDIGPNGERLETIAVLEEWLKRWEWIGSKPGSKAGASRLLVPDTFKILGRELFRLAMGNEAGDRLCDLMQDPANRSDS